MGVKLKLLLCGCILLVNSIYSQVNQEIYYVYFESDKAIIQEKVFPKLTVGVQDTIFIEAHCDWQGSRQYNADLAMKRARSVELYLRNKMGIPEGVIVQKRAFGEEKPIGDNQTAEGRQSNRRADIIIRREPGIKTVKPEVTRLKPKADSLISSNAPTLSQELQRSLLTGKNIRIDNLNFKPGLDIIVPQSEPVLFELLKLLEDNPKLEIELQGYVCCTEDGSDGANFRTGGDYLSRDRAKAVYDFLIEKGIDRNRLEYNGFGGSNKIANPEVTLADQNANRRVEIRIKKN